MTFEHENIGGPDEPSADILGADILDSAAGSPRRPRARLLSAVVVVGVGALVAASLLAGKYLGSSLTPTAFVTQAAQRTLAEHTAGMTLSGTMTVDNVRLPLHGTGEVNFTSGALDLTMGADFHGEMLTEHEIGAGEAAYLAVTVNGTSYPQNDGGRPWMRMPLPQSRAAGFGGGDPSATLSVLAQKGNKVRTLGTKVIGGVTCTGYAVTTGKSALIAGAKAEQAATGTPASVASGAMRAIENIKPPVYTVWFSAQELLRRMTVHLSSASQATGIGADLVVDFSDYGAPVHISAPSASKVIDYGSLAP